MNKLISLINPDHPASIFVARKTGLSYEENNFISWDGCSRLFH